MPKPYRNRTWLRNRLPEPLADRIPLGRDCGEGSHEWFFQADGEWACYHCRQETNVNPYPEGEWARRRAAALLEVAIARLRGPFEDDREVIELAFQDLVKAEETMGEFIDQGRPVEREILVEPVAAFKPGPTLSPEARTEIASLTKTIAAAAQQLGQSIGKTAAHPVPPAEQELDEFSEDLAGVDEPTDVRAE